MYWAVCDVTQSGFDGVIEQLKVVTSNVRWDSSEEVTDVHAVKFHLWVL